jgi:hypothetical protein
MERNLRNTGDYRKKPDGKIVGRYTSERPK